MDKRVRIFVGAYGSGKTEVAVNYAMRWSEAHPGQPVAIVDLDIVNPYFRSREMRESFSKMGIQVIAPMGELTHTDLPIITPHVRGTIDNPDLHLVLDVGGDDAGSRALSQFSPFLVPSQTETYMVINSRRPWTSTVAGIVATVRRVETSARFRVTALVSNPNLGEETTIDVVHQGHALVVEAARSLDLPVAWLCVSQDLAGDLDPDGVGDTPVIKLQRHFLPPWYEGPLRNAPYSDNLS